MYGAPGSRVPSSQTAPKETNKETEGVDTSPEAQKAREEANKKARQRRAEEFREQCYLTSKMEHLARDNSYTGTKYKNFTVIAGNDASPNANINQLLWYKDQQLLMSLSPAQMALLVPKIRVFVVTYKGDVPKQSNTTEKEVRLQGTSYDLEKLLADPASRGQNLGLKSFTWQMNGTDPWTATNLFQANMSLWGDSLKVFEDPQYESLLLLPQPGRLIEIKVVVGWNVPTKVAGLLSPAEIKAIKDQSMNFLLTLTEHDFDFQQDGSFNLTLKYRARLDVALSKVDLLGASGPDERRTDLALAGVKSRVQTTKVAQDFKERTIGLFGSSWRSTESDKRREMAAHLAEGDTDAQKLIHEALDNENLDPSEITYDFIKTKILTGRGHERMSRIVRAIENIGTDDRDPTHKSRVYNVRVSAEDLDAYFDKYGGLSTVDREGAEKNKKDKEARAAELERAREKRKKLVKEGMSEEDAIKKVPGPEKKPPPKKPKKTPPNKSTGKYNRSFKLEKMIDRAHPGQGTIVIPFIFLGDLLEAVLGICKFQLRSSRVNFILGTMIYNNPITQKSSIINLVDIPISLRRFSAWFHKKYNERPVNTIPLKDFLQSVMVELIRPGLTSECFLGADMIGRDLNRIGGIVVTTRKNIKKGRVTIDQLVSEKGGLFHSPGGETSEPLYNNFLFTSMMDPNPPTSGDQYKDSERGIMHYHLGRDKGLLKRANFARNNVAGLSEHRMTREVGAPIDRMRQPYNVDLELAGNTFMRPGTIFYITPTVPGRGSLQIADRLGLGGYYVTQGVDATISPGSFLMNVKGIWNNESTKSQKRATAARQAEEEKEYQSLADESIKAEKESK
jgi:hypothetical protein